MLAFSGKWIEPILQRKKTLTLRKWPSPRVKVGGVYDAVTIGFPRKTFARLRVTGLQRIRVRDITAEVARRDGAASTAEVRNYWLKQGFDEDKQLWAVEFELAR